MHKISVWDYFHFKQHFLAERELTDKSGCYIYLESRAQTPNIYKQIKCAYENNGNRILIIIIFLKCSYWYDTVCICEFQDMHPQLLDMNFHRNHPIMCFLKHNSSFVNIRSSTYTLTGDPRNFKMLLLCCHIWVANHISLFLKIKPKV